MRMQAYTFVNNETGEHITLYAKISDVKSRRDPSDVFRCNRPGLGVFDGGYVDVTE